MGTRHSRRQLQQQQENQVQTEPCQTQRQHQSSTVASSLAVGSWPDGGECVENDSDEQESASSRRSSSSLVIKICMLMMEPSKEATSADSGEESQTATTVAAQLDADSERSEPMEPPKCGCFLNSSSTSNVTLTTNSTSSGSSLLSSENVYGGGNNSQTQTTASRCGCHCNNDSVNNNEPIINNIHSVITSTTAETRATASSAAASDCANNNDVALISDILNNHHNLLHHHHLHHHHHHHHHHMPSWTCPTSSLLATVTTAPSVATTSYPVSMVTDIASNNANVLTRTMQQHQQHLRQQQLLLKPISTAVPSTSPGPVSPSLMLTASTVCEMSDKLSDLNLTNNNNNNSTSNNGPGCGSNEEHPFSVGECPRCAVASAKQSSIGETEEKILNTTPGSEKEPTKTDAPEMKAKETPPSSSSTAGMTASTLLSSLTSSGKKNRACKCCRSSNCANQGNSSSNSSNKCSNNKSNSSFSGTKSTNAKSKKGNWGLKFNCAKLRGTKSNQATITAVNESGSSGTNSTAMSDAAGTHSRSSGSLVSAPTSIVAGSSSSRLLSGESERADSCVCTAYRRVEDLPAFVPTNIDFPMSSNSLMLPHTHPMHHHHYHVEAEIAATASNGAGGGGSGLPANQPNHAFLFPPSTATTAPAGHHDWIHAHHHHRATAIIHRIDRNTAQALLGTGAHLAANSVLVVSSPGVSYIARFNGADDISLEDCDERARLQRELEIREGVDVPGHLPASSLLAGGVACDGSAGANHQIAIVCAPDSASALNLLQRRLMLSNNLQAEEMLRVHSQVDFIHCLVPDLQKITGCCFYWGKMDRYEAEKLLEGKPEGTFLLRDSAQEDFLFSVSFRKYCRSLHARIEQFNHKFSFDSRDPGVYTSSTVTGLLEHYKDPSCVMFFEPMLTHPLKRNFCFSLQQLCRATIVSNTTYDGINELPLPKSLKSYLKEYHYRQRVRFKVLDEHLYSDVPHSYTGTGW
ncbi:putative uncharacterized protein DDB_G0277255 [Malaya genurostris]|uniref:putative uncharacterized protein DDB_G0277255 n=1 Tax=Malaya genurostris TaxID=325434 RepID=UPI0026F38FBA|nr:putative uncharacterized protein DDB_G0277255 [Malaya genurostris]XP_058465804.1 putative uncharacterized protein DDB_G0277255 [Malaya genurostris]XP_058465805.1 putative uncharacterized protein DDB_G0277255 [Malaya genurostris]